SFKVGIAPEAITDGRSGFLSNPGDLPDYLEKLSTLILDRKLRKRMGAQASKTVRKQFSSSKMASGYLKLYRKLLSK
ncbi:MAG: glycosyltransferase family 1 protein, partial [Candidatus Aenigmarchaeota archaeon]|nr:glycosyltransferase family 1 protein [Candidatus Aenigmarchaeota archaeon]